MKFGFAAVSAALASIIPACHAEAKTAFQHELSMDCAGRKSGGFGTPERFSNLDLALTRVHMSVLPADTKIGETRTPLTPAQVKVREQIAMTEFLKAVEECQREQGWTDAEKGWARDNQIASSAVYHARYHLGSPRDEILFNQLKTLSAAQIGEIRAGRMEATGLVDKVAADLNATNNERYGNVDYRTPAKRLLIVDAYREQLEVDRTAALFRESAKARFPASEPKPVAAVSPAESLTCPRAAMAVKLGGPEYRDLALKGSRVASPFPPAQTDARFAASKAGLAEALAACSSKYGWGASALKLAELYASLDAGYMRLYQAFDAKGVDMEKMISTSGMSNEQAQTALAGKFASSGSLDAIMPKLKASWTKLNFTDATIRGMVEDAFTAWVLRMAIYQKFAEIAKAGFKP